MKDYFISIEYWNSVEKRFIATIITVDLTEVGIGDIANDVVSKNCDEIGIDFETVTSKILSFNRI